MATLIWSIPGLCPGSGICRMHCMYTACWHEYAFGRLRFWESAERLTRHGAVDGVAIIAIVSSKEAGGEDQLVLESQFRPSQGSYVIEVCCLLCAFPEPFSQQSQLHTPGKEAGGEVPRSEEPIQFKVRELRYRGAGLLRLFPELFFLPAAQLHAPGEIPLMPPELCSQHGCCSFIHCVCSTSLPLWNVRLFVGLMHPTPQAVLSARAVA